MKILNYSNNLKMEKLYIKGFKVNVKIIKCVE